MLIDRIKRLRKTVQWLDAIRRNWERYDFPIKGDYKHPKVLDGQILSKLNLLARLPKSLHEVEFQVFSQFGDDGILQYLIHKLRIDNKVFLEFGVENYIESCTRFLLINDKWSGLVLDGDKKNVGYIKNDLVSHYFNLEAVHAFVTAENINQILVDNYKDGQIGILCIDIDGMDYWVWKALDVVDPDIVVIEYNALFGNERSITVPYDQNFIRSVAHQSLLYWGSSLPALINLANEKGMSFIGCNSNGNNAYFIKYEYLASDGISQLKAKYVSASFAEYKVDERRLRGQVGIEVIRGMPVINVLTGEREVL